MFGPVVVFEQRGAKTTTKKNEYGVRTKGEEFDTAVDYSTETFYDVRGRSCFFLNRQSFWPLPQAVRLWAVLFRARHGVIPKLPWLPVEQKVEKSSRYRQVTCGSFAQHAGQQQYYANMRMGIDAQSLSSMALTKAGSSHQVAHWIMCPDYGSVIQHWASAIDGSKKNRSNEKLAPNRDLSVSVSKKKKPAKNFAELVSMVHGTPIFSKCYM
jgi:hypothetical protein